MESDYFMKPVAPVSLLLLQALLLTIYIPGEDAFAQTTHPRISAELWARATPPGGSSGAIYGRIENNGDVTVTLHDIRFSRAKHLMIHETVLEDGMMKMKHREVLIEPGQSVSLVPGGLHIMLMGLSAPLKSGCQYSIALDWGAVGETAHQVSTGSMGQAEFPRSATTPCQ